MLIFTRKVGESITVGDPRSAEGAVEVTVENVGREAVRLGVVAPKKSPAGTAVPAGDDPLGRAIAAATNGIVLSDPRLPDCPIIYTNDAFLRMTGYAEDEVVGRNCRFLQGPDTDPETVRVLREAVQAERPCQVSILNYRKDGTSFWNEVTISPVRDARGDLTHFVGIQTDVTARQTAEMEHIRAEETLRQFQLLAENANDSFFLINADGRFLYVNPAACRSLGYSAGEFEHLRVPDVDPVHDEPTYRALFLRLDGETLPPFESVQRRKDGTTFPVEASVTRLDIGAQALLFSSARDISERKSIEEERIRLTERERNISQRLQHALQPDLPRAVAGLALAKYYDAALAEASVGGDFYDVFATEKGCSALVVGDLSGKGLAAATQVATVRNMLRAFVYSRPGLSAAVTELNAVLAENNLLTGFTTLFIGVYSAGERTLRYVNCGQEPALLRRSATGRGQVEQLAQTGPVLGSFEGAAFEERTIVLSPGDAVAILSDGLTEVGSSRTAMLGIGGVAALLESCVVPAESDNAETVAEHLALALIEGVDAAASEDVMRDDICLLVGVIT